MPEIKFRTSTTGTVKLNDKVLAFTASVWTNTNASEAILNKATMVVVVAVWDENFSILMSEGTSRCSPNDKIDVRLGVNIALGRAIKKLTKVLK
jgi:hypothetical protein